MLIMYNILNFLDFHDYIFNIYQNYILQIIIINNKLHINFIQLLMFYLILNLILM